MLEINCHLCDKPGYSIPWYSSDRDLAIDLAAGELFDLGWRVIGGRALCKILLWKVSKI